MLCVAREGIEVERRRQAVGAPVRVERDVVSVAAARLDQVNLKNWGD